MDKCSKKETLVSTFIFIKFFFKPYRFNDWPYADLMLSDDVDHDTNMLKLVRNWLSRSASEILL